MANDTPLELQSFTEVCAKAIAAIPANTQFGLLLQIECKCSRCQQPQPVVALPLHSEQDSSEQHSVLPDLGQLVDLAISYLQQNLSPRNDVCKLEIRRLPSFFCILTHKVQRSALGSTIQVVQHSYNVLAIVLHDPKAKHYIVLHRAKEHSGESISLYDSIYGVRKENIWAGLTKPTLYIGAIFIRSASIISHYPATALLASFGEIVRHHANLNELSTPQHAGEQVQGKAENTNQEATSRDSPVPTQTYFVPNTETDLGLPDPSHVHLLPDSETSEVGPDLVIVRGNGHKGPDDDKPSTVSSIELMQKSEAVKGYGYQATEHQGPVPCLGPALPTQPDSPTQPEIHSIATSSEDDIAPETTKANGSHNSSGTGEQSHSHPSRIKPRITGRSQVLRTKKGHERQNNPNPSSKGKPCTRSGKAMRVSSEG